MRDWRKWMNEKNIIMIFFIACIIALTYYIYYDRQWDYTNVPISFLSIKEKLKNFLNISEMTRRTSIRLVYAYPEYDLP